MRFALQKFSLNIPLGEKIVNTVFDTFMKNIENMYKTLLVLTMKSFFKQWNS